VLTCEGERVPRRRAPSQLSPEMATSSSLRWALPLPCQAVTSPGCHPVQRGDRFWGSLKLPKTGSVDGGGGRGTRLGAGAEAGGAACSCQGARPQPRVTPPVSWRVPGRALPSGISLGRVVPAQCGVSQLLHGHTLASMGTHTVAQTHTCTHTSPPQ